VTVLVICWLKSSSYSVVLPLILELALVRHVAHDLRTQRIKIAKYSNTKI
jgi:hypothetical protein